MTLQQSCESGTSVNDDGRRRRLGGSRRAREVRRRVEGHGLDVLLLHLGITAGACQGGSSQEGHRQPSHGQTPAPGSIDLLGAPSFAANHSAVSISRLTSKPVVMSEASSMCTKSSVAMLPPESAVNGLPP